MKRHLHSLKLICRKSEELVTFAKNVSFFHGTLSSGKSSIARLIDFCLGGDLEKTTALRRELVSTQLNLTIGEYEVLIERNRDENQVQVTWANINGLAETVLIRTKGDGAPVIGQDVVNLSDLILHLLGYEVIRVRKRTGDDESPMVRLSFRDLFKFCYLEQEELDSSFFRLNTPILAEKSKDALNFFTGYYSEALSALEIEFDPARTRDTERSLAAAQERARFLARIREMPTAVMAMLEEADAISADLQRLQREIAEEQRRLSFADRNFAALAENFLEALLAVRVPGVEPNDKVVFNRRTLVPEIWPAGDRSQAYSFYTSGSGGKKVLITICFALALHRTAAVKGMSVPTLLIIDTPLKNITPDINPELVEAFYRYLYSQAEGDLRNHQLVIIDQKLVTPSEESFLVFFERYLTTGDPTHPPLISYYQGP